MPSSRNTEHSSTSKTTNPTPTNPTPTTKTHRTATALAALATLAVVLAFTVGKAWVSMPGLWEAQGHRIQQVRLNPLDTFTHARVWWGPWFNLLGNIALFLPVGYVGYVATRGSVAKATVIGALLSLAIETSQYIWALGYSDADDLIFNTLGAWCGGMIGASIGKSSELLWTITAMSTVVLVPYLALGLGL